jgi:DNA-binding MarR family transcriptional regulator
MTAKSVLKAQAAAATQRRTRATAPAEDARVADARFDRLVYERVRLGIMSALAVTQELSFSELKAMFDVSDGNLSAHARKLEEAGYVSCTKSFADRRPKSAYRLTAMGRQALNRYLDHVEAVIRATRR